jgi:3-hydroxyisobutyrate dehydrogenase-like beta-hydroxyacid dehydrogenase
LGKQGEVVIVKIAPENLEVANAYLSSGDAASAGKALGITPDRVHEVLAKSDVKEYVNSVYLDQGYRNRFRLAELLDEIIENKIQEAREAGVYSSKDLVDIIGLAHKMSTDANKQTMTIKQQNNVQINSPFGEGNYGKLMEKLLGQESGT